MSDKKTIIELKHLGKEFQGAKSNVRALRDINLEIQEGEIFGIIGLSGAGKSTLVRCMNYLEEPTEGAVIFDGKELGKLSDKELREARRAIGMIFQQFNLLSQRNILRNISFPLEIAGVPKKDALKRAKELLEVVGLGDKAKAFPAQLSGGQKQRVAIARALAANPKVLLCDEATSALDPNTTKSILDLLREINQKFGITIIIITHEMKVVESVCHRVAIIDQSQIAECGLVEEVFSNPKSQIGRHFILGDSLKEISFDTKSFYRIIFDGLEATEPVIGKMALACGFPVNIAYASTKRIGDKAFGQMVIQVPANVEDRQKVIRFLETEKIPYEEVEGNEF